ncbi:hypothetical protein DUI87_35387 [Hirundo rustica rustica]|uniref:SERRATE/Ars2 N-terminal domain-containing protein n=1 Tax=Hirundo rustica rustica TaxID=333673 RepID=A0A3M0IJD0_HIRRU|nr:hypothetical protein DUI87_35387 [Hirundo rustica rustica]
MGDSDDEYDRRRRDKFRRERSDYDRSRERDERRRDDWSDRDWERGRERRSRDYRDYDRTRRERFSPPRHELSPPQKRLRRDWDDHGTDPYHSGYELPYSGGGAGPTYGPPQTPWGPHEMQHQLLQHQLLPIQARLGTIAEVDLGMAPPVMKSFKEFLLSLDDAVDETEAVKRYNDYKLDFRRQQLQEFFLAHKDEEWFRSKYHPDEAGKRQQEAQAALRNRLGVFLYLWEHGWFDNLLLDIDRAPQIIKTLDAEHDLRILEQEEEEERTEKAEGPKKEEPRPPEPPGKGTTERPEGDDSAKAEGAEPGAEPSSGAGPEEEAGPDKGPKAEEGDKEGGAKLCKRYPGFMRVALSEPQPERRFFRRGWVTFDRSVNIKEICWSLQNIRLRERELSPGVIFGVILMDFRSFVMDFEWILRDFELIFMDFGVILMDFELIVMDFEFILRNFGLIFVDFLVPQLRERELSPGVIFGVILTDFRSFVMDFEWILRDFELIFMDFGVILMDFELIVMDFEFVLRNFGLILMDFLVPQLRERELSPDVIFGVILTDFRSFVMDFGLRECELSPGMNWAGFWAGFWVDFDGFWVDSDGFWVDFDRFWVDSDGFGVDSDGFWVDSDGFWVDSDGYWVDFDRFWVDSDGFFRSPAAGVRAEPRVNRDLTRRVRNVSGLTQHRPIVRHDIKLAARLVQALDARARLWSPPGAVGTAVGTAGTAVGTAGQDAPADGGEPPATAEPPPATEPGAQNPVLRHITDYLIEECPQCPLSVAVLDRLLLYLRIVHSVDYYNTSDYPNEDEMPNRCGIIHGPEFVRKHIFNKHGDKMGAVRKEVLFFNNFLMDPKRPALPEGGKGGPAAGPNAGSHPYPPGPYGGRGSYETFRGQGGPGGLPEQTPQQDGAGDPRAIVEYRDLDAPEDVDFF